MTLLTVLKGLPLAYNKDMQEDKEAVFDAIDTVKKCLSVFAPMIRTMKPLPESMYAAAQKGFINATDLADYLVRKGLPFRTAYKLVGQAVAKAIELGKALDQLPLETLRQFSPLFEQDVYEAISLEACMHLLPRIPATNSGTIDWSSRILRFSGTSRKTPVGVADLGSTIFHFQRPLPKSTLIHEVYCCAAR